MHNKSNLKFDYRYYHKLVSNMNLFFYKKKCVALYQEYNIHVELSFPFYVKNKNIGSVLKPV